MWHFNRRQILRGLCVIMMILAGCIFIRPVAVRAESGTIYACTIHPCYRHPVSGVIEDSGGEAAYATGQGMVEGCVATEGMLEVTDSGKKYLTMRLSLVDYTSDHTFQVQNRGDSEWTDPAVGITGEGSDKNGTTWDITMEVPSEECVVRGTMMVTPMGRSVIFYLYPDNFTPGEEDGANGMKAAMVTGPSGGNGKSAAELQAEAAGNASSGDSAANGNTAPGGAAAADGNAAPGGTDTNAASGGTGAGNGNAASGGTGPGNAASDGAAANTVPGAQSQTSSDNNVQGVTSGAVDKNAGLNLSTEEQTDMSDQDDDGSEEDGRIADPAGTGEAGSVGERIFINVVSGVLIGSILMGIGALIFYVFRKKSARNLVDPDEYDDLYRGGSDHS